MQWDLQSVLLAALIRIAIGAHGKCDGNGREMWADAVSMSFVAAFVIPGALWLHGDMWYGQLLGSVIVANLAVAGLKQIFGTAVPFGRPQGATGCDLLCRGGSAGGQPGFPSGHMTTATLLVSALWFHTGDQWTLWIGVPWIAAMAWARWSKRCHNWQQIVAGTILGSAAGWIISST